MANITYVGSGTTIVWGTNVANQPNGILTTISASLENQGETINVLSELGIPDGFVIVPGITKATIEGYASTLATPAIGAVADIAGTNVYAESVRTSWEQKGIKRITISGSALPA